MWISKEKYDDILARLNGLERRENHVINNLRIELGELGLVDYREQEYPKDGIGLPCFVRFNPAYPIVQRFKELCETLGYEWKEETTKSGFVKVTKK